MASVASLLVGVAATELGRYLLAQQFAYDALRTGFVLISALGSLALAVVLLTAPATRWPGVATLASLVTQLLVLGYRELRTPGSLGPHAGLWVVGYALTPLVVDAVVRAYAGRPLPLGPLVAATLGTAGLDAALVVAQQVDYVGGAADLLLDPAFYLASVVVGPLLLVAGAVSGWLLGLRKWPRSGPAAG